MAGKRSAEDVAPDTQPSVKRQTLADAEESGCGSGAAAPAAVAAAKTQPEANVSITFTMRGDPSANIVQHPTPTAGGKFAVVASADRVAVLQAYALDKAALEAALSKVVAEWGFCDTKVVRTRVGPSGDTLQLVLPILVEWHLKSGVHGGAPEMEHLSMRCFQASTAWWRELKAQGFCRRTFQLCSTLARGGDFERLQKIALRRLNAGTDLAERVVWMDFNAFLQRHWGWGGSEQDSRYIPRLQEWLQAASQDPDASFLSRGAASTAKFLFPGMPLVKWAGKPQGRYPVVGTLSVHTCHNILSS